MTKWGFALLAGTALLPAVAPAQTTAPDAPVAGASNDIIVTAQRYQQRLQDVPLSVSVIGSRELAARAVTSLADLQYSVPGLSIYDTAVGRQTIQMRGISTQIGAATVGVYLDETPLALDTQGDAFDIRLLDLERVEVLRGPQATLYGQGSMGGTIRYIPAAPRLDRVAGAFDGEISSTRDGAANYRASGMINLPIATDKLGLRVAAGYERVGGYIDNVSTGAKDINSADIYTVRGSLLARPTERLSLSLLGLHQKSDLANQNIGIDRKTSGIVAQPARDRYILVQGKLNYDLDFADLSGSVAHVDRHNVTQFDTSPLFVPVLPAFGFPVGFVDRVALRAVSDYKLTTGEVRLASQGAGAFGWQAGIAYRDLQLHQFGGSTTAPGTLPFALIASDDRTRNRSYALYGEAHYALTARLKATVGLRYFHENKQRTVNSTSFGVTSLDIGDADFHTLNPRFNLSYEFTSDSMAYVNVAKGFRSGGFNQTSAGLGLVTVPPTYTPDSI